MNQVYRILFSNYRILHEGFTSFENESLQSAIHADDITRVEEFLKLNPDLNQPMENEHLPLHAAVRIGNPPPVYSYAISIFLKIAQACSVFHGLIKHVVSLVPNPIVYLNSLIFAENKELIWTTKVCKEIGQYFLARYKEGSPRDIAERWISGRKYVVQRYNHGLAHGLRQGALAKDIVGLLLQLKKETAVEITSLIAWIDKKIAQDPDFFSKLEMASSFQRSARQSEVSSSLFPKLYKKFELQDSIHFRDAALKTPIFKNEKEIKIFQEAILWSNKGELDENIEEDLKFLKQIFHAAHTFDLRRILSFDEKRIKADGLEQLFGKKVDLSDPLFSKIVEALWNRSGQYLEATGDRDLTTGRGLQNEFFIQSHDQNVMINAISNVRSNRIQIK